MANKKAASMLPSTSRLQCRQLNSRLKIIFPRKSNYQRETNVEFTGFFGTCVPLNDGGVRSTVAKISAPSVIDRLRSGSRGLLLVRECRGMKNPFAKKAVVTNKRQQTCCRPPPRLRQQTVEFSTQNRLTWKFVFFFLSGLGQITAVRMCTV